MRKVESNMADGKLNGIYVDSLRVPSKLLWVHLPQCLILCANIYSLQRDRGFSFHVPCSFPVDSPLLR